MEILSNIRYGRCSSFHYEHEECNLCCCECKDYCKSRCSHSKYIYEKRYCGNYKNIVELNNSLILHEKLIQERLVSMTRERITYQNKRITIMKKQKG